MGHKWYTVNDFYNSVYNRPTPPAPMPIFGMFFKNFTSETTSNFYKYWFDVYGSSTYADFKSKTFDTYFLNKYKNFRFYDQDIDSDELLANVFNKFQDAVFSLLATNKKKYEELIRINNLDDLEEALFNEVDYTITDNGTTILGQRQDSTSTTNGARTDTLEEQVSPFEASTYQNASKNTTNKGAETDSESYTKGAETDSNQSIKEVKGKQSARSKDALIKEHADVWERYMPFISVVFEDVIKEFFLI